MSSTPTSEKKHFEDTKVSNEGEKVDIIDEKVLEDQSYNDSDDDSVKYVHGEPVITTGKDVSRFAVDLRDDGDQAFTLRSIVLGTVFAGLGAALCQVRLSLSPHLERSKRAETNNSLGLWLVITDLSLQTHSDDSVDGVPAFDHVHGRAVLGKDVPWEVLGRRHTVLSPWASPAYPQSGSVWLERGMAHPAELLRHQRLPELTQRGSMQSLPWLRPLLLVGARL